MQLDSATDGSAKKNGVQNLVIKLNLNPVILTLELIVLLYYYYCYEFLLLNLSFELILYQ